MLVMYSAELIVRSLRTREGSSASIGDKNSKRGNPLHFRDWNIQNELYFFQIKGQVEKVSRLGNDQVK